MKSRKNNHNVVYFICLRLNYLKAGQSEADLSALEDPGYGAAGSFIKGGIYSLFNPRFSIPNL